MELTEEEIQLFAKSSDPKVREVIASKQTINIVNLGGFRIGKESSAIQVRTGGKFANVGLWLDTATFNWSFEEDDWGHTVLVPKLKL